MAPDRLVLSLVLFAVVFGAGLYAGLDGADRADGPAPAPAPAEQPAALPVPAGAAQSPASPSPGDRDKVVPLAPTLSDEALRWSAAMKIHSLARPPRLRALPPAEVVAALGVRPGMTVVDVGAGAGYFTFPLLDALQGQGRLFATDVDARMLAHIDARAASLGQRNLTTVKVTREGLDPFYRQQTFDLILLSSVLEYLPDPVAFLTGLRGSLRPGSGRLAILQGLPDDRFRPRHFGPAFLHRRFLDEGPDFPARKRLPAELLRALEALAPGDSPDPRARDQLASAFADMLADPTFPAEMSAWLDRKSGHASELLRRIPPGETRLTQWLIYNLDGLHDDSRGLAQAPAPHRAAVQTLGSLILRTWFDPALLDGDFFFARALYLSNPSVIQRLAQAGLQLEREIDRFEGHAFLVFRRSDP